MAKGMTMWKTEDGKVFDTKEAALAHEFAVEMCRKYQESGKHGDPYNVFVWLYTYREAMGNYFIHVSSKDNE